jgi:hypothetical protein
MKNHFTNNSLVATAAAAVLCEGAANSQTVGVKAAIQNSVSKTM